MSTSTSLSTRKTSRLQQLAQIIKKLVHSRHMLPGVAVASFLESTIVPVPLETILIPLMQAQRKKILLISTAALLGCLLGAAVGYAVGYFIFEYVGEQLINLWFSQEQYEQVVSKMSQQGFWFIFSVGVTPVPFQLAMLAAGATQYALGSYLLAAGLSRSIRYYGLALLVALLGDKAEALFKQYKTAGTLLILGLVIILWLL